MCIRDTNDAEAEMAEEWYMDERIRYVVLLVPVTKRVINSLI